MAGPPNRIEDRAGPTIYIVRKKAEKQNYTTRALPLTVTSLSSAELQTRVRTLGATLSPLNEKGHERVFGLIRSIFSQDSGSIISTPVTGKEPRTRGTDPLRKPDYPLRSRTDLQL